MRACAACGGARARLRGGRPGRWPLPCRTRVRRGRATDPWARLPGDPRAHPAADVPRAGLPRSRTSAAGRDGARQHRAPSARRSRPATRAGGGRVVVPAGEFLTGADPPEEQRRTCTSSEGATLRFSTDPARYLPVVLTRWEGVELHELLAAHLRARPARTSPSPARARSTARPTRALVAVEADDGADAARSAATATGCSRWPRTACPVAQRVFGAGHFLRPNFIQPYRCRNVLIEGVTIRNSPMWEIHPVLSHERHRARRQDRSRHGPNNDGCNPESSRDVLIEDSLFDTGDDCIAHQVGPQRRRPARSTRPSRTSSSATAG